MTDKTKKVPEAVDVSCKLKTKRNGSRLRKSVKESDVMSHLIEDIEGGMDKWAVVLAAQNVTDELQTIAQKLAMVQAKDVMELFNSISQAFGEQGEGLAAQFNQVTTQQFQGLVTSVQNASAAIEKEILRMKRAADGGDISDMGMDAEAPGEDMPPAPGSEGDMGAEGGEAPPPPTDGGLPEIEPDMGGNAEDDGMSGGFAGRAKKESAKRRGNKLSEDFLGGDVPRSPAPAIDQHPHKSSSFDTNLGNLGAYHGKAGQMARNIESMIDSEALTGDERKSLANVLSHFAMRGSDASSWSDPETKLTSSLQAANLWDYAKPAVAKVVAKMRQLAHFLNLHHEGMVESAIKRLRESSNPDALVLKVFRLKLAERHDAQMAAIKTARLFAIDVDDVVAVIREAAEKKKPYFFFDSKCPSCDKPVKADAKKCPSCGATISKKKEVKEFKMNTPDSAKGMFKGDNISDLKKRETSDKASIGSANEKGEGHANKSKDLKRVNFAIRAKHKGEGSSKWHKKVNEEDFPENKTSLFPVQAGNMSTPNPGISNPGGQTGPGPSAQSTAPAGGPNQNASTRRPMTPGDRRNMQAQGVQQAGTPNKSGVQAPQTSAMFGNTQPTMVPPGEEEVGGKPRPGTPQKMAPVKNVTKSAMPAGKVVR